MITGAGVSAESGVPTFRGAGGLWNDRRAEDLATPEAFAREPGIVWRWYGWRLGICRAADPNPAHSALVRLERAFDQRFLLATQNVDDLHRRAGTEAMVELHGCIERARCSDPACGRVTPLSPQFDGTSIPRCEACGAALRPHILWFGESYWPGTLDSARMYAQHADLVVVIGTSGMVWAPVAVASEAQQAGAKLIDINPQRSEISEMADDWIAAPAGEALPALLDAAGIAASPSPTPQ